MKIFCIYDQVSCEGSAPMMAKNESQAMRMFERSLENHPDAKDFGMYYLAEFDTESMMITGVVNPKKIVVPDIDLLEV